MKKILISLTALFLLFALILPVFVGCSSDPLETVTMEETQEEEPVVTKKPTPTKKPAAENKDTEEEGASVGKVMQTVDPAKDDTLNVLMIGNSFCYYFVEELYGIAKAAGVKMNVCNVYYSGCSVNQHWSWLQSRTANYQFFTTNEDGRSGVDNMTLKKCLAQKNWDVITLQQHLSPKTCATYENALSTTQASAKNLYDYLKQQFPMSDFYWHETWSYEKGFKQDSGGTIKTDAEQLAQYQVVSRVGATIAAENQVGLIPTGAAWQEARKNPLIGDTLCKTDHYHDGDTGGGQYLNACVWFEAITGKSCIGNGYTPNYSLSRDKINALQVAAHSVKR